MLLRKAFSPVLVLFLVVLATPLEAGARIGIGVSGGHRGGARVGVRVGFPMRPFGFGFGYTHRIGSSRPRNAGTISFKVKPVSSEIYVDGAFLGLAKDLNSNVWGTKATLRAGPHDIRIVSPDGTEVSKRIYVMPGKKTKFRLDL
jgi:hypothetical protein